jgi:hypothetical protein
LQARVGKTAGLIEKLTFTGQDLIGPDHEGFRELAVHQKRFFARQTASDCRRIGARAHKRTLAGCFIDRGRHDVEDEARGLEQSAPMLAC